MNEKHSFLCLHDLVRLSLIFINISSLISTVIAAVSEKKTQFGKQATCSVITCVQL